MDIPGCLWPFTSISIDHAGDVHLCPCVQWTGMKAIGNIHQQDLADIWNSESAVRYRKVFLAGRERSLCDGQACAYLQDYAKVLGETGYLTAGNQRAMEQGSGTMPDCFTRVKLDTDRRCNLRCKMCRTSRITEKENDTTARALELLEPLFPHVMEFHPATAGEPLFIPEIRALLQGDTLRRNNVNVEMVTNASLFTESLWQSIRHNSFAYVKVSLDAVTKDVYESIRIGSKHAQLMENLQRITRLKQEGRIKKIQYTIVVMRSNYPQLPEIVQFAERMDVDNVKLLALNGEVAPDEILTDQDRELLVLLLKTPEMQRPIVDVWGLRHLLQE